MSGVVEETPGRLEYEVALYKEAPPTRVGNNSNSELPVDQAVPIGTKLQLRARINPDSGMLFYNILLTLNMVLKNVLDKCSIRNNNGTLTPWLMEPRASMLHSEGLSNNPYPEPNQPNFLYCYLFL